MIKEVLLGLSALHEEPHGIGVSQGSPCSDHKLSCINKEVKIFGIVDLCQLDKLLNLGDDCLLLLLSEFDRSIVLIESCLIVIQLPEHPL